MTNSEIISMLEGQGLSCACDSDGKVTTITVQDMANISSYELYDIPEQLDLIIPDGMKSIGWKEAAMSSGPFFASRIRSVRFPESLEYIGAYAFFDSELENVVIPASVREIGEECFSHTDIESITFLGTDIKLGECCFPYGSISVLKEIHIPAGSTGIFRGKLPESFWKMLKDDLNGNLQAL